MSLLPWVAATHTKYMVPKCQCLMSTDEDGNKWIPIELTIKTKHACNGALEHARIPMNSTMLREVNPRDTDGKTVRHDQGRARHDRHYSSSP